MYDSDMVAKPEFLEMTIGHFYEEVEEEDKRAKKKKKKMSCTGKVAGTERATKDSACFLRNARRERNRVFDIESGEVEGDGECKSDGSPLPLSSASTLPKPLPPQKESIRHRHFRLKHRTAFVQVPQDFYNVPWNDPLGHAARFFYGPMMQGRDGMNATPCGTMTRAC